MKRLTSQSPAEEKVKNGIQSKFQLKTYQNNLTENKPVYFRDRYSGDLCGITSFSVAILAQCFYWFTLTFSGLYNNLGMNHKI